MKLKLPATVASSQDLVALIGEVHVYAKWAARELIKQRVSAKRGAPQPELSPEASDVIRTWSGNKPLTQASIDSLIKALEDHRKAAPTISITLAAIPSGDVKARLVEWVRKELAADMLINFRVNRNILGGLVVASGSHIFDWSFRRKLLNAPRPFHEVLQNVR